MMTWRVRAALHVPKLANLPSRGLAGDLEFQSRIQEQSRRLDGLQVAIRKSAAYAAMADDPQVEVVELVADAPAHDVNSALAAIGPVFERIVDLMSFEMAAPLRMGSVAVLDVTTPVAIGDDREFYSYSDAPFDTHARAIEMQAVTGVRVGSLPLSTDINNSEVAAALRWFVKGLGTSALHDQFIFLWIALEILCDASDVRVTEPLRCPNGHIIAQCLECDADTTTERVVRGRTLRSYLEQVGVSESRARELWKMRQLMHGAIPFDSAKLAGLGGSVQTLRAAVTARLKEQLAVDPDQPPMVADTGLSMHPAIALGGKHPIEEEDLSSLW
jgi:hypothetical protein